METNEKSKNKQCMSVTYDRVEILTISLGAHRKIIVNNSSHIWSAE
jgi:hypothetical protein